METRNAVLRAVGREGGESDMHLGRSAHRGLDDGRPAERWPEHEFARRSARTRMRADTEWTRMIGSSNGADGPVSRPARVHDRVASDGSHVLPGQAATRIAVVDKPVIALDVAHQNHHMVIANGGHSGCGRGPGKFPKPV